MNKLEIYELINSCETRQELKDAIKKIGELPELGCIPGRTKNFNTRDQIKGVDIVIDGNNPAYLTRNYGIRQQALYIKHYEKKESSS